MLKHDFDINVSILIDNMQVFAPQNAPECTNSSLDLQIFAGDDPRTPSLIGGGRPPSIPPSLAVVTISPWIRPCVYHVAPGLNNALSCLYLNSCCWIVLSTKSKV